jgi:hypothetical protein
MTKAKGGYHHVILEIDLTTGSSRRVRLSTTDEARFAVGRGLGMKLLWDHLGTAGDCRTNSTEKVASGASTSTYSGGVLSVAFTAFKTGGVYSGTGTYSYTKNGRTFTFAVAHACMNKTTKTMTVWGPGTSNQTPYTGYGMLSLKDYGTSMGTRAAFGSSLASLPTTTQCSGSPLFPATGTGFLTFW